MSPQPIERPETHPNHFTLLRLAILRGLSVEQTAPDTFLVGSHSHAKHAHTVNPVTGKCCCPAFGWCSHLARALDYWMEREAEMVERLDYFELRAMDFGGLLHRDLPRDDRRYVASCVEKARAKYSHLFVETVPERVTF